jgi:hypothetical protein
MSYFTETGGVVDKIGEGLSKGAGAYAQYQALKAAASGQTVAPSAPADEDFNWTPVLLIGGIGIVAYLLLKKK